MMDHKFIGLDVDDMIFGKDDREISQRSTAVPCLYPHGLTVWFFCTCLGPLSRHAAALSHCSAAFTIQDIQRKAPKHANGQPAAAGCPFPVQARPAACRRAYSAFSRSQLPGGPASVPRSRARS